MPKPAPNDPSLALTLDNPPQQVPEADVQKFLRRLGEMSRSELVAVLRIDQRQRWKAGERRRVEDYLQAYPAMSSDTKGILELVQGEIALRRESGEPPSLDEYLQRFPQFTGQLLRHFNFRSMLNPTVAQRQESVPTPEPDTAPTVVEKKGHNGHETKPASGAPAAKLPSVVGYEVIEELGRGGMGIVYKARQRKLNRLVALKMLRDGLLAGPQQLARFETEARAVARLRHPSIVQIHEIGEHEGRPYLCLELVEGGDLAERLKGEPLPPDQAAALVEVLARAIHHAHVEGIIHRDLKPANVLLVRDDSSIRETMDQHAPRTTHQPKITDFGLAKHFDDEVFLSHTPSEALMGTPSYMAPEQAWGKTKEVGPPADIYALGAILFELLTGRPPFVAERLLEVLDQVRSSDPPAPRSLCPQVPRDLETICLKCLRKEPERRYATAHDLAEDLRRFLAREPIMARRTPAWERLIKWGRRRPALASLLAVSSIATMLITVALGIGIGQTREADRRQKQLDGDRQAILAELKSKDQETAAAKQREVDKETERANVAAELAKQQEAQRKAEEERKKQEQEAQRRETELQQQALKERDLAYYQRINQAERALGKNEAADARLLLADCAPLLRAWEWDYLSQLCAGRGALTFPSGASDITSVAFHADGSRMALGTKGAVAILDTTSGKKVQLARNLAPIGGAVHALAFSADGQSFATASTGLTGPAPKPQAPVRKDLPPRGEMVAAAGKLVVLQSAVEAPDPKAAAREVGEVMVWDLVKGERLFTLAAANRYFTKVAFSPDGKRLATAGRRWTAVEKIPPEKQKGGLDQRGPGLAAGVLAYPGRPDLLVLADDKDKPPPAKPAVVPERWDAHGEVILWDASTGKEILTLPVAEASITAIAFSPDGQRLASAAGDGTVTVWSLTTQVAVARLAGHTREVSELTFSPDGQRLASAGKDETVRVWDIRKQATLVLLDKHTGEVTGVAFHPEGKRLATSSSDRTVRLWDEATGQEILTLRGCATPCVGVRFSADGRRLATASSDGTVKMWATGPLPDPPEPPKKPPVKKK